MRHVLVPAVASIVGVLAAPIELTSGSVQGGTSATVQQIAPAVAAERSVRPGLVIASANIREGSRVVRPVDNRHGADRAVFAARVIRSGARPPDVLLLQEAMGSAWRVVSELNQRSRQVRAGATYRVVVPSNRRIGRARCAGRRAGHQVIRDGAIVVNTRTARVADRGLVKTWGRWFPRRGQPTYGCAEQTWALVGLRRQPGQLTRIANVHAAPSGHTLKNEAVIHTVTALTRLNRATPRARLVVGGDLNLSRCQGFPSRPERLACAPRAAHRALEAAGLRDVVRTTTGSRVVGVRHRIDFLYASGRVADAWWDRCYLAFQVTRPGCTTRSSTYSFREQHAACQRRADLTGSAGGPCHRYYSDHPILRVRL